MKDFPGNRVLDRIIPKVFVNNEKSKYVRIKYSKKSSLPSVILIGENGSEICAEITYIGDEFIDISLNEEICYTAYIY